MMIGRNLKTDMELINQGYSVEGVLRGHPDKICDQISDALLDEFLSQDEDSKVAIECLGTGNTIVVAGEINSKAKIDIEDIVKRTYRKIVWHASRDINVINLLSVQSQQLQNNVKNGNAADQGIMYGYACNNEYNYLPYGYYIVNKICKRLDEYGEKSKLYYTDGKVQVVVKNEKLKQLYINVQHEENADLNYIETKIKENVLYDIDCQEIIINKDKWFIKGGIENDTGVTGRKIIIDSYGGLICHGGGAFSGKDPSKLDRSAAYMCRYVAKNLVANNLASDCLVTVAYMFGKKKTIMLKVFADNKYSEKLTNYVSEKYNFETAAIVDFFNLKNIQYLSTATYGHFTNSNYPWEKIK